MLRLTTVILERDGKFHAVLNHCSIEDAERWVEHGYLVFRIGIDGRKWAVNFVNEGKVFPVEVTDGQNQILKLLEMPK